MIRTEIDSMPSELDDIRRKIMQLEIEEMALKKEDDQLSKDRLAKLREELAEHKDKFNEMKARWESEKDSDGRGQEAQGRDRKAATADIERAQLRYEYETAAKLKYSELPALQKKLAEAEKEPRRSKKQNSMVARHRDRGGDRRASSRAGRVSPWRRLVEGEREKLLHLDDILHQRVVGQDEAVQTGHARPSSARRAGIADPNRPIGQLPVPRPHGRRQDGACEGSGRVPV